MNVWGIFMKFKVTADLKLINFMIFFLLVSDIHIQLFTHNN